MALLSYPNGPNSKDWKNLKKRYAMFPEINPELASSLLSYRQRLKFTRELTDDAMCMFPVTVFCIPNCKVKVSDKSSCHMVKVTTEMHR